MKLRDLALDLKLPLPDANPDVTGVTHNAEWVRPGDVFVAIRGARFDGHEFTSRAAELGAVAVAGEG
ncbi:Mur ligase domain-containing protein, partial [Deinococcus pimensis]|uniref:Mur ligase domain-containing protein n=1 Tax=Deinococcus pimensis TaxID=309888 RepID=UPI0005EAEDFE